MQIENLEGYTSYPLVEQGFDTCQLSYTVQIAHVAKTRLIYCFSGSQLAGSKIYLLLLDLDVIRAIYKPVNVISYFNHSTTHCTVNYQILFV